jgi:predicted metalloprotease
MVVAGCAKTLDGKPISIGADPTQVAGKPVTEDPSGLRPNAPGPVRPVEGGDGGDIDHLAAMAVADIEQFWAGAYGAPLKGKFAPVKALFSWDSRYKHGRFCGGETANDQNAAWCGSARQNCPSSDSAACTSSKNTIGWDRGPYLTERRAGFGDMGVAMTLAHEYGHAIQYTMADLIQGDTAADGLAAEQQADCFGGVYMRWVVDGKSPRFTLSTGDALSNVMATRIAVRDPLLAQSSPLVRGDELIHGSAFERVTAFQFGFTEGTAACAGIDAKEVLQRRAALPKEFLEEGQTGEYPVTQNAVKTMIETLTKVFSPANPPKLSFDPPSCSDAKPTPSASYCPSTNTIAVDMNRLILLGTSLSRGSPFDSRANSVFGDYTAYSVLASRFMLAIQKEHNQSLDNTDAGLRTACLTGVATTKLAKGVTLPNGNTIKLYGGDLDEAVSGVLTNGMIAGNVNGEFAPSGFARIDAYRTGVLGDQASCTKRWP